MNAPFSSDEAVALIQVFKEGVVHNNMNVCANERDPLRMERVVEFQRGKFLVHRQRPPFSALLRVPPNLPCTIRLFHKPAPFNTSSGLADEVHASCVEGFTEV